MVQSMYLNLTIAKRLFVFYILDVKSFRTYRNINISNLSHGYDRGAFAANEESLSDGK